MNTLQFTRAFIEAALAAAKTLSPDAKVGAPIRGMDGYFIIQMGRKPNGDKVISTIEDEEGTQYDIYAPEAAHAN